MNNFSPLYTKILHRLFINKVVIMVVMDSNHLVQWCINMAILRLAVVVVITRKVFINYLKFHGIQVKLKLWFRKKYNYEVFNINIFCYINYISYSIFRMRRKLIDQQKIKNLFWEWSSDFWKDQQSVIWLHWRCQFHLRIVVHKLY